LGHGIYANTLTADLDVMPAVQRIMVSNRYDCTLYSCGLDGTAACEPSDGRAIGARLVMPATPSAYFGVIGESEMQTQLMTGVTDFELSLWRARDCQMVWDHELLSSTGNVRMWPSVWIVDSTRVVLVQARSRGERGSSGELIVDTMRCDVLHLTDGTVSNSFFLPRACLRSAGYVTSSSGTVRHGQLTADCQNGNLVVSAVDNVMLYDLDSGVRRWSAPCHGDVLGLHLNSDFVVVEYRDHGIACLSIDDGHEFWSDTEDGPWNSWTYRDGIFFRRYLDSIAITPEPPSGVGARARIVKRELPRPNEDTHRGVYVVNRAVLIRDWLSEGGFSPTVSWFTVLAGDHFRPVSRFPMRLQLEGFTSTDSSFFALLPQGLLFSAQLSALDSSN
jgi:hypothetical protein